MATEEESEETTQKSTPKAEENAPPKKTQGEEKPVYKFPHQVMMQKIGKKDEDADENTKEYINDFNDFLKHVKMTKASAEKKGQEWKLPDAKKSIPGYCLAGNLCHRLGVDYDPLLSDCLPPHADP